MRAATIVDHDHISVDLFINYIKFYFQKFYHYSQATGSLKQPVVFEFLLPRTSALILTRIFLLHSSYLCTHISLGKKIRVLSFPITELFFELHNTNFGGDLCLSMTSLNCLLSSQPNVYGKQSSTVGKQNSYFPCANYSKN